MHRGEHPVGVRHRPAGPRLPPVSCHGRYIGVRDIVECLSSPDEHCEFLMSFGHRYYCNHPQRLQIVKRMTSVAHKPSGHLRVSSAATHHAVNP